MEEWDFICRRGYVLQILQGDGCCHDISRHDDIGLPNPKLGLKMPVSHHIIEQLKQLIPPLNGTLHKGQSGILNHSLQI